MAMGTVGEMAVVEHLAHLGKEVRQFLGGEVDHTKLLDAWSVDEERGFDLVVACIDREKFGKGSGVFAFEAPLADLARFEVKRGVDGVEESRFADTTVAAEERDFARDEFFDCIDAHTGESRDLEDRVAGVGIDSFDFVVDSPKLIVVEVALVEYDDRGDMVGFGGDEEAVDKASRGAREAEGGDNTELVDIGGDDVSLLAEFGSATDDAVAAIIDCGDKTRAIVEDLEGNMVADGDGVGLLVAANAEIAPQAAGESFAAVGQHIIPTTCSSDN